jgi:hypothetical protein
VVREIVKLALAAAIIVIAGSLIALFASGYISAFKPGGTKEAAGKHVVGSTNTIGAGGISVVNTPAPSPSPQPAAGMPETVQMPPGPEPTMPPLQEIQPPVTPGAGENPYLPVMQPSMPPAMQRPMPAENPVFTRPTVPLLGQGGLLQLSNWLLRVVPALFPALFPGWTWWS